ncbi:MAG: M48 family metallopeptidase, partial [Chitinophagaceae bacterium]
MTYKFRYLFLLFALSSTFTLTNCAKDKNGERLLFTVEDDIAMGEQTAHQVDSIYADNILSRADYPQAYAYLESAKQEILNSGKIAYKDEFAWKLTIIDDTTLNAFCTPGGHIYFYTGLIKYLDSGDHLIGVLGHEMAHADKRHTSQSLQREYGLSVLLGILTGGNPGMLTQIAASLASLDYSREHETEADEWSVEY